MKLIGDYLRGYEGGDDVVEVLRGVWEAIEGVDDAGIFISKVSWEDVLDQVDGLPEGGALRGVPFVVKDNIDVAGMETTAGCREFGYVAEETAYVVRLLQKAGAVLMGKTNLDQFATGLVGVRTPYPVPRNVFDADFLPGGSSSGSAVAVARGLVPFSLGTDTAGSGRVPAAFNGLVGLKPSLGFLSTRGVVDACKSLDCVSVFAHTCEDADAVLRVVARYDEREAWSREVPRWGRWKRFPEGFRFGVPAGGSLDFHGFEEGRGLFEGAVERMEEVGGCAVEIDLEPFLEAARLLYEGPWVTERFVGLRDFLEGNAEAMLPVTRKIVEGGRGFTAADYFAARYRLEECRRRAGREMAGVDFVMTPTAPRNFLVEEVEAEPVRLNSVLGTYTNFMNLLDYAAVALPAGRSGGGRRWGVTIFGERGCDRALLAVGARYEGEGCVGGGFDEVEVVVCGAHMSGLGLNWQLVERGGELVGEGRTAGCYRMFLVPEGGGLPERPALVRALDGRELGCEVWRLGVEAFGDFVAGVPGPLGIGKVELEGGEVKPGFIAEAMAMEGARDVTEFGGWREFLRRERG